MSNNINFEDLLSDSEIEFTCPDCNSAITIKISDIGKTITCPNCSVLIDLKKDSDFDSCIESMNKSLKDFDDTINSF